MEIIDYNLVGKVFGYLTVVEHLKRGKSSRWNCRCKCGRMVIRQGKTLRDSKYIASCGCGGRDPIDIVKSDVARRMMAAARKAGHNMSLTKDRVKELICMPCHYCGATGVNTGRADEWKRRNMGDNILRYNGLDRVDSSKEYTEGNVVTCCITCNRAKSAMPVQDFLAHCHKIVDYQKTHPSLPGVYVTYLPYLSHPDFGQSVGKFRVARLFTPS